MKLIKQFVKKYFQNFTYFYRYLGYRVFTVMALSILVGLLDGMGLTMFLPLLQMADGKSSADSESLGNLGFFVEGLNNIGIELTLINALIFLMVFFALKGLATYASNVYKIYVRQFFIRTLRLNLVEGFTKYSFKSFVLSDIGRIQNTLTGEVARVSASYTFYFSCFQNMILVTVYMLFAFMVDWKFALLTSLGGLLTNLIYRTIYKKTKQQSALLTKNTSNFQGLIIQFIQNFKYLKATGTLTDYSDKLNTSVKTVEAVNTSIGRLDARITSSREPLLIAVICGVIGLQIYVMDGTLASVLISLLFFYRALTSLMGIQSSYNSFLGVSGSMENMTDFEKELKSNRESNGNKAIDTFTDRIVLKDVGFGYSDDNGILNGIDLTISKNQTVAFVGESGSGKTTLVSIISGLMKPNLGQIEIDGLNVKDIDIKTFQKRIGYISQDPVIFNDTLFNNVSFWAEDNATSRELFEKALRQASILDFVESLPEKGDTLLGNNGINLSGGQKQRISIARELYKNIDILILDEATSALDSENERNIQENIENLQGEYTILIIAHRLSTVKNADIIYLMDQGSIIDSGDFGSLLDNSARFKKMVEVQDVS